jgi:hypothetical protein
VTRRLILSLASLVDAAVASEGGFAVPPGIDPHHGGGTGHGLRSESTAT